MRSFQSFFPEDYPDFEEFGTPPCATSDPDAFFSEDHPNGMMHIRPIYRYEREAKMTCLECPYIQRCRTFALENPDVQGIWGGTTERERNMIRKGVSISIRIPASKHL